MKNDEDIKMEIKINEILKNDFFEICTDLGLDTDTASDLFMRALHALELELKKSTIEKFPAKPKKINDSELVKKLRRKVLNLARAFGVDEINGIVKFSLQYPDPDSHITFVRSEFILDLENPKKMELRLGKNVRVATYEREIWKADLAGETVVFIKETPDGLVSLTSPQEFEETISYLLKIIEISYIKMAVKKFKELCQRFPVSDSDFIYGNSSDLKKNQETESMDYSKFEKFSISFEKDSCLIRISLYEDKKGNLIECRITEENYDYYGKLSERKKYSAVKRANHTGLTNLDSLEYQIEEEYPKLPVTTKTISGYDFFQKFREAVKEAEVELPRKSLLFDYYREMVDEFLKKCEQKKNLSIQTVSMNKESEDDENPGYYRRLLGATPYGVLIEIISGGSDDVEFIYLRSIYFEKESRIETAIDVAPLFAIKRKREDYLDWETAFLQYPGRNFEDEYSGGGEDKIRDFPDWIPVKFESLSSENVQNKLLGTDNISPKKFKENLKKMIRSIDWEIFTAEADELLICSDKPEEIVVQSFEEEQTN